MIKGKKGQVYIFMAILLCAYAAALVIPQTPRPAQNSFRTLHENYMAEVPKVVNSALYNGTSPSPRLANFTDSFITFARSSEPKFGVLYAYSHDGVTDVRSRLNEDANITTNTTWVVLRDNATVISGTWLIVRTNQESYEFNLTKESRFAALFISKSGRDVKVFKV